MSPQDHDPRPVAQRPVSRGSAARVFLVTCIFGILHDDALDRQASDLQASGNDRCVAKTGWS